jgi:hypothetical protein
MNKQNTVQNSIIKKLILHFNIDKTIVMKNSFDTHQYAGLEFTVIYTIISRLKKFWLILYGERLR